MKHEAPFARRFVATAVLMGLSLPFLFYGSWKSMEGIFTSALKWLSPDDEGRQQYDHFVRRFEGGNAIMVSWKGCRLSDSRLERIRLALLPTRQDAPIIHQQVFKRVFTGASTLERMTSDKRMKIGKRRAIARLQGTLIGPDGDSTCLIAVLTEDGVRRRREALELVVDACNRAGGISEDKLFLAGPPVDAIAIDKESNRGVEAFSIPSAVICFFLCWFCLRSMVYTMAILMTGAFGELLVLGSLYYANVTMDAVLIVLPPLVFVLTVSAGVHLVNYYYDELRRDGVDGAAGRAIRNGFAPCALAAVTTAIGLGSLLVSHIVPVRMFGLFASCGVLTTVALLFAILPGVMQRWPAATRLRPRSAKNGGGWNWLSGSICKHPILVTGLGLAALVAGFVGVGRIRTSVGIRSLFDGQSRVMRDYTWMEEHIARLIPLEVVVHFPPETKARFIERIELIKRIQVAIDGIDRVGGTMSVATLAPEIPRGRGTVRRRAVLNSKLKVNRHRFVEANYLYESEEGQDWRISSRVSGLGDADYEHILADLKNVVDPLIAENTKRFPGLTASFTGSMPVVFRAQKTLLQDMFFSMLTAFLLVWVVMILVLAKRPDASQAKGVVPWLVSVPKFIWLGFLAMLPNLFPIVVIFGWMGWRNAPVDIGSMMTACVALGIAVDDTLHFLAWYRRELHAGATRTVAIQRCFDHCGKAMLQTTIICGFGLLVFSMSSFVPTGRFAWLMLALLTSALVADLMFLPAILASPLGRVFGGGEAGAKQTPEERTEAAA